MQNQDLKNTIADMLQAFRNPHVCTSTTSSLPPGASPSEREALQMLSEKLSSGRIAGARVSPLPVQPEGGSAQ